MVLHLWITSGFSLLAIIISILSYTHNRRTLKTEIISKQRIDWINNVRSATTELVNTWLHEDDVLKTEEKKYRVELFLNPENKEHKRLIRLLNSDCFKDCADKSSKSKYIDEIVSETQALLNNSWRRMKIEAGMSKRFERKRDSKI